MRTGDLSAQFGRPATAETRDLGGILSHRQAAAPPKPAPAATTPAEGEPNHGDQETDQQQAHAGVSQQPGQSHPTASTRPQPAPAAQGTTQSFQVPTYVVPSVKNAAQQRRVRDRITNAEIAFAAIDATFSQLHQLLSARRTVDRGPTSLFPPRTRRAIGSSSCPDTRRVAWVLQATAEELSVLDTLVTELGAESRSELIAAALETYLLGKPRK